jgi:hypothetical protein
LNVLYFLFQQAKVFFKESFGEGWEDRWVESTTWKDAAQMGKWEHTAGVAHHDENDKGIQTGQVCVRSQRFCLVDQKFEVNVSFLILF